MDPFEWDMDVTEERVNYPPIAIMVNKHDILALYCNTVISNQAMWKECIVEKVPFGKQ